MEPGSQLHLEALVVQGAFPLLAVDEDLGIRWLHSQRQLTEALR